jgi:hypothetical protein
MNSPTLTPIWHGFAQGRGGVFMEFAMMPASLHCFRAGQGQLSHDLRSLRCYPSPSLRSGPSQAGPTLPGWQVVADCASGVKICFEIRGIAVDSNAITTTLRGSIPCASRFSSSSFFPCPWPVACRTPHRAVSPVRRRAPLSPMRPTATCLLARSLAVSPGLQPAVSRSACRLVTRATDTAAFGRTELTHRTIRATRPGGPFAFPMGGADV